MQDSDNLGEHPKDHGLAYSFRAFKHRNFTIFWMGAILSNIGAWLSNLAVPFVLYAITGEALWVGLASAAQFLPGVLLGPWGGALADRFDRQKVLIFTQLGMALSALGMWLAWRNGFHDPQILLLLVMFMGCFNGLNLPSWQSFVTDLVPRADLMSAVTLNSLQFNAARSLGPAIAGLLLATFGPEMAFLLNGLSFTFVIVALLIISLPKTVRKTKPTRSIAKQFFEALVYVRRTKALLSAVLLSVIVGLLGNPLFSLTVVYAEEIYQVDALGLGLMNAALGAGALLAAPIVSGWSKYLPASQVVKWGLVVYGIALATFSLTTSYWLGILTLVVIGACFLSVISGINTSLQLQVADHMRGRVIAIRHMCYTLSFPVGAMILSTLTDLMNVQIALFCAGAMMVMSVGVVLLCRSFISFDSLNSHGEEGDG